MLAWTLEINGRKSQDYLIKEEQITIGMKRGEQVEMKIYEEALKKDKVQQPRE